MASDNLRQRLEARPDEELLEILRRRDTSEWQPSVFPVAEEILRGRGINVGQALGAAPQSDVGQDQRLVTIATFATVVESEACRSALAAAGFRVLAGDQFMLQVDPALGPALGGLRLLLLQVFLLAGDQDTEAILASTVRASPGEGATRAGHPRASQGQG